MELSQVVKEVVKVERYKDKLLDALGDLTHAENHVSLLRPDVAEEIRGIRKRLELEIYGEPDSHKGRGHK